MTFLILTVSFLILFFLLMLYFFNVAFVRLGENDSANDKRYYMEARKIK